MRSSPGSLHLAVSPMRPSDQPASRRELRQQSIQQPRVRTWSARTLAHDGAALFAAHCSCPCRDQSRNHGVSDPGARARFGPAPVRRGRSRHGCQCPVSNRQRVRSRSLGSRRESGDMCARIASQIRPENLVPFVRDNLVPTGTRSGHDSASSLPPIAIMLVSQSVSPFCARELTTIAST